jgi:hypothetical protein
MWHWLVGWWHFANVYGGAGGSTLALLCFVSQGHSDLTWAAWMESSYLLTYVVGWSGSVVQVQMHEIHVVID